MWYFIIISVIFFYLIFKQQNKTIYKPTISNAELKIEIYRLAKKRNLLGPATTSVYDMCNPSTISLNDYQILKKEILCKKS